MTHITVNKDQLSMKIYDFLLDYISLSPNLKSVNIISAIGTETLRKTLASVFPKSKLD